VGGGPSPPSYFSSECESGRRNEIANGSENREVGFPYGVGPDGGVMEPLRKLPTTAKLCDLCGRRHGGSDFILYQTQNRDPRR